MSLGSPSAQHIATALAHGGGRPCDAPQIAETVAALWLDVDVALAPILGHRGVAALYQRSLHLNRPTHPYLAPAMASTLTTLDVAPLAAVLAQQTNDHAAAAGGAVLQTFHELLSDLIGASLTERLLRSVWATFLNGETPRDFPT
jgi:hypothetical protein